MPRIVKSRKPKGFFATQYVRRDLRADLSAAQARFDNHVVGRPLMEMIGMNTETGVALRREGVTYDAENLLVDYLLRHEVQRAVTNHRTEDAFEKKIAGAAPQSSMPVLVQRGNLEVVSLDPPGTNERVRTYGVVAMCAEVFSANGRRSLDIDAEADAVRVGLLGNDAYVSSPQLWLGALTMPACMAEFALEQLELSIPSELRAGQVGLVAARPLLV